MKWSYLQRNSIFDNRLISRWETVGTKFTGHTYLLSPTRCDYSLTNEVVLFFRWYKVELGQVVTLMRLESPISLVSLLLANQKCGLEGVITKRLAACDIIWPSKHDPSCIFPRIAVRILINLTFTILHLAIVIGGFYSLYTELIWAAGGSK